MRIRTTTLVTCKRCSTSYQKRNDTLKHWSGYCRGCISKEITIRGKYRNRGTCAECGKVSYWIKASVYCQECGSSRREYAKERHWNWKGGKTSRDKYERSRFLKYYQPKVLKRDDYTCKICDQRGGKLHVDHIKQWSEYPELRFDMSNCRTLCVPCHYYVTFKRKLPEGSTWGEGLSRRIAS